MKIVYPVLSALFIVYIIRPVVRKMERKGIRTGHAILILYAFILLTLAAVILYAIPGIRKSLAEITQLLPSLVGNYKQQVDGIFDGIQGSTWPQEIKDMLLSELGSLTAAVTRMASGLLSRSFGSLPGILTFVLSLLVGMVTAFYLIRDGRQILHSLLKPVPVKYRHRVLRFFRDMDSICSSFISGQFLVALMVGILEGLGLWLAGVRFPAMMGLIGGLSNIIPYFGPFIGALPATAISLAESVPLALKAAAVFVLVQQADNAFITPKIIGKRLGLHPLVTIFAVLTGAQFFGIPGMVIAVPAAAIGKHLLKQIFGLS
ncbi:MAG TPA: AI-2E family transporter [Clostridiales bacterium]|nr:AI-2E family transporter [Clostridiales bacterium]